MLVLVGAGALLGPSVFNPIDVPLSSNGRPGAVDARGVVHLLHGGLQLSIRELRQVAVGLGMRETGVARAALAGTVVSRGVANGELTGVTVARSW